MGQHDGQATAIACVLEIEARGKPSAEVRERAVRMLLEQRERYVLAWEAVRSIAGKLGGWPEGLLQVGEAGGARPPAEVRVAFIDEHREAYGVEPICRQLPIVPSVSYEQKARERAAARWRRDATLREAIERAEKETFGVDGAYKVWRRLRGERGGCGAWHGGAPDASHGPSRRRAWPQGQDDDPDDLADRPQDLVKRNFTADGRTKPEIIRCSQRYVAREIFDHLRSSCAEPWPGAP